MGGLEDKCKGTLKLLKNGLDQLSESEGFGFSLGVEDVLGKDSNSLGIGIALKIVPTLLQNLSQCSAVGDDAIVNDEKLRLGVGADRVAIALRRRTMSSPSRMSDRDLSGASLLNIKIRCGDLLAQTSNLANFFKVFNCSRFITVDGKTCRVVSTIFLTRKASA